MSEPKQSPERPKAPSRTPADLEPSFVWKSAGIILFTVIFFAGPGALLAPIYRHWLADIIIYAVILWLVAAVYFGTQYVAALMGTALAPKTLVQKTYWLNQRPKAAAPRIVSLSRRLVGLCAGVWLGLAATDLAERHAVKQADERANPLASHSLIIQ